MKAITVKQPWASLIVEGIKDVENRTWECPEKYIGKRVLIHADAERKNGRHLNYGTLTDQQIEDAISKLSNKATCLYDAFLFNGNTNRIFSAIIGSVEIVDCVINHKSIWAEKTIDCKSGCPIGKCPHRIYNWVLANPIKFPKPIQCKGKLGFWEHDMICPEFSHFGASYPDARCIDGYLYDLDSLEGDFLTVGGDDPCPYCNPSEYIAFNK